MSQHQYGEAFYDSLDATSEPSATIILPMLLDLVSVNSAIDVGCGDGSWLNVLRQLGIEDVLGLDAPGRSGGSLKIPESRFRGVALDEPFSIEREFDLALCLEVAEHLPPERAAGLIADLSALAPIILFSAAIPGQGGVNHFNEQWPAFWAELFANESYVALDPFRRTLWNKPEVAWWYKQNMILFVLHSALLNHPSLATTSPPEAPLALVHPDAWKAMVRRAEPGFGRWLRMAMPALARSLGKDR